MRTILTLFITLSTAFSFGQLIKFKVTGQNDTTVHLVKYYGQKLFYADTAVIKNGIVQFDGKKQIPGMLALLLPEQKMVEFIYNNEEVHIETEKSSLLESLKIKKSEENILFAAYVQFITEKRKKVNDLSAQREKLDKDSEEYKSFTTQIDVISKEVSDYQKDIMAKHPTKLVSKMILMSIDVTIPDAPRDENGNITDSNFQFNYYRSHYFDNIDLTDSRLVNFPLFHNKLENYFSSRMMVPHWDTVLYYAYDLCDKLDPTSKMFEYSVSWITSNYGKSKQMGMDKVYTMMADKYYCSKNAEGKSLAFWMADDKLKELCEKTAIQKHLVMGAKPHNLILRDSTDIKWVNLFEDIDAEYTILYFWDPECGHCKKTTPKLETLYQEKFKDRNIEIYSVGKAVGEDFEKWKKFIRDNKLTYINVAVTESLYQAAKIDARQFVPKLTNIESLNYHIHYDIYATPRVFVLNKDKEIIAKQISISQLEDLMDRLQGKTDLPKLFPPDPEEDEQMH